MKRVFALAVGLVVLAGCGAVMPEVPMPEVQSTTMVPEYTTIPSAAKQYPDPRHLRCVASLPEDNIYLYSYNDNMLLFQEGYVAAFYDWDYEKYDYPRIAYFDIDGDGEKEIAVATIVGSGTGLCITDLHILKVFRNHDPHQESIEYREFILTNEDVTAYVEKNLKCKRGKEANTVDIAIDGKSFTADLDPAQTWLGEINSGIQVYFSLADNRIKLRTAIDARHEHDTILNDILCLVTADIVFDGEQISLTNIELVPGEWPIPED